MEEQVTPYARAVMNSTSPKIAPHQGMELELMLQGKKPLAKFAASNGISPEALGDAEFQPYVSSGHIKLFSINKDNVEWRIYCLPSEEWRAKLSILMIDKANEKAFREIFNENDLHRMDGTLLGYDKSDIEFFIEKIKEK
ncbi:hemin receptor [Brucella sp. 22210]|uniref:hemin receptor n=1 Tax=Brucella sp. 22210 TaxID=3453892 RepID=UPI003F85034D